MSPVLLFSVLFIASIAYASESRNEEADLEERAQKEEDTVVAYESLRYPVFGANEAIKSAGVLARGKSGYGPPNVPGFPPLNANYAAYLSGIGLADPFGYAYNRYGYSPLGAPSAYGYGAAYGYPGAYAGNWAYGNPALSRAAGLYGYGVPSIAEYRYGPFGYAGLRAPALPAPLPGQAVPAAVPAAAVPAPLPAVPAGAVPAPYPGGYAGPFPGAPVPGLIPAAYRAPLGTTQNKDGSLRYVAPRLPAY